jgi:hypothetical protein
MNITKICFFQLVIAFQESINFYSNTKIRLIIDVNLFILIFIKLFLFVLYELP